nr:immunoglobulin heavy chain junction region [Mus musculus]MBK4184384.1 immunoglobulin heavy chain junction region [Mus musculus]MBK4184385.1 immunoglobulin heavy chain junction region [Mus musculus]MBK4184386.1 immunoglobulin heavy chain junction region [Mus musculus]MBK4184387.1 immunoglobulin heavy chain junction region [Mus musculus]
CAINWAYYFDYW